ncbi:substance-P receptor-like [Glandiceps talaboti]
MAVIDYWVQLYNLSIFMNLTESDVTFDHSTTHLPTHPLDYDYASLALPRTDQVILTFAFSVNMVLSLLGNILVLLVLLCGRSNRTDLTAFLINLSVADLTMAIFCMPFTFPTIMLGHWVFGTTMCYVAIFLQHVSVVLSIGTLTAVGIDRYFVVIFPLKARFTKSRSTILFIIVWFSAIILSTCQTIFTHFYDEYYDHKTFYFCSEQYPSESFAKMWEICFLVVTYFLPLTVLTFTYSKIAIRLWGRHIPGNADESRDRDHSNSKQKVIKMLVVIVVMFALCWLPLHIFKLVTLYNPSLYLGTIESQDRMRVINACVLWLALSNSFVNPFIYGFLNEGFRADAKILLKTCRKTVFLSRATSGRSITLTRLTSTTSRTSATKYTKSKSRINSLC